MRALLLACLCLPLAGQTFILGTASDPCTGGQPLTIFQTTSTVRWDNTGFTCNFQIFGFGSVPDSQDGPFTVELDFLEPCVSAGACAAGQVTQPRQRLENVYINDTQVLSNYDPYADIYQGVQLNPPTTNGQRIFTAFTHYGNISVRVQTVVRSAVLARVVVSGPPWMPGTGIAESTCVGSGTSGPQTIQYGWGGCTNPTGCSVSGLGWDCTGLKLVKLGAQWLVGVPATPTSMAIPTCPGPPGGPCWQPVPIGQ